MKHLEELDVTNKKVFLRVDFNVPLHNENKSVTDTTRIESALQTIHYLYKKGATVIVASHLGRPKGTVNMDYSMTHIHKTFEDLLGMPVHFVSQYLGGEVTDLLKDKISPSIILLENLRFFAEEEKGDKSFAHQLAQLADVYVNDAFGAAHRAHASTAIMAEFFDENHKAFGYLMQAELNNAYKILSNPTPPTLAIIGGAKVSDKILLIENLLNSCDELIIGGGMAFTFLKAQGLEIGKSLCEDDSIPVVQRIIDKAKNKNIKIHLPVDCLCAEEFDANSKPNLYKNSNIPPHMMGLDIGANSIENFSNVITSAKTILWNGPMGVFEFEAFAQGTKAIATAVANATQNGAYSLIGGGDSVAAIKKLKMHNQVSYISTGGGALLELFEGKILPGVKAIQG